MDPRNTHVEKSWIHEIPTRIFLDRQNTHEKKFRTYKITARKKISPTKYLRENILYPRNSHEKKISDPRNIHEDKLPTHKIPTRIYAGPKKYPREKMLDSQNTLEKKFRNHEILMRKYFGPTKYQREKILDPQKHNGTMAQDPRDSR